MYVLPQHFARRSGFLLAAVAAWLVGPAVVGVQSSQASSVGTLTAAPSVIYFGNVIKGQVKRISCTVTNTGSASLTISRAHSNNARFVVTTPRLPAVVKPGGKAVFSVAYSPTSFTHSDASIIFNSSASNSAASLPIHGTGVEAGTLRAAPASIGFGSVPVGTSTTKTVTLTNVGFSNVKISSDSIAGYPFSVSGVTMPTTLTPAESITFTAKFAPGATGTRTGSITMRSSATNPAMTIALSGTSTSSAAHDVKLAWTASKSAASYNIYRGTKSGGPYSRINSSPDSGTSYMDGSVAAGSSYYYVTTAVSSDGTESSYSGQAHATIPSP